MKNGQRSRRRRSERKSDEAPSIVSVNLSARNFLLHYKKEPLISERSFFSHHFYYHSIQEVHFLIFRISKKISFRYFLTENKEGLPVF